MGGSEWKEREREKEKRSLTYVQVRINSFKDPSSFDQRIERWEFKVGKNICHRLSYRQPCRRPWAKMYFRTVRNHRSTSTALKICISRKSGPKTLVARIITPSFFFFFLKKRRGERKNFSNGVRIRVRDEPGLRSFRLKLIQRDELLSPSSWHFTIPLFKIPAIFLAIVSSLEQFIVASGHEFRFFFFSLLWSTPRDPHDL